MKIPRFVLAFAFATVLLAGHALAGDQDTSKDQCKDKAKDQAACTCGKDKDGKTCGTDKDCCCTGAKATKDCQRKDEPKPEAKTDDAKKN